MSSFKIPVSKIVGLRVSISNFSNSFGEAIEISVIEIAKRPK